VPENLPAIEVNGWQGRESLPLLHRTPVNGKNKYPFHYQLGVWRLPEGYKYLGAICNHIISKYIPQFLVFYFSVSGVRY
jgi:hypothetical protein